MTAEFSASLLQSYVPHDSSEIILIYWFGAQETFLLVSVENGESFLQVFNISFFWRTACNIIYLFTLIWSVS